MDFDYIYQVGPHVLLLLTDAPQSNIKNGCLRSHSIMEYKNQNLLAPHLNVMSTT